MIDQEGRQLGVVSRAEALNMAAQAGLDLVEISPNAKPPVAKIIDWGKYNYQKTKQQQKNKKQAKAQGLKQMRMGLKIGDHDLDVKLRKVSGFLEDGHKVKMTLFFRGRELAHKDVGFALADKIIDKLGDSAIVDQKPQMTGKQIIFVIRAGSGQKPKTDQSPPIEASEVDKS